jgi:hypothetical protein
MGRVLPTPFSNQPVRGILVELPIATKSPNRVRVCTRGGMMAIISANAKVRDLTRAMTLRMMGLARLTAKDLVPAKVTFTRVSAGTLDYDNCVASMKVVQDSVCKALGVDDGDRERVTFVYQQMKGKRGKPSVRVLIEARE